MRNKELYRELQQKVIEYLTSLPVGSLGQRCHYCPAWSNQDVLAHHIHALRTIATGDPIPGAARDAIVESDRRNRVAAVELRNVWTQAGLMNDGVAPYRTSSRSGRRSST